MWTGWKTRPAWAKARLEKFGAQLGRTPGRQQAGRHVKHGLAARLPRLLQPVHGARIGHEHAGREFRIAVQLQAVFDGVDRKSTRLNSSHLVISYAVFCLKKKKK